MRSEKRHFIISSRHKRVQTLWRTFFAGWGLLFTLILIVSPFVVRNMTWSILDAVDFESVRQNNMSLSNLKLFGTDKNGEPFSVFTHAAFQRFSEPDIIHFETPVANIVRIQNGKKIRDKITADKGRFLKNRQRIVLSNNVLVESDDGTTARANQMEIDLK